MEFVRNVAMCQSHIKAELHENVGVPKSYSIRTTVRDDFVPLSYNGQGGKTHATGKVVPPASGLGGGEENKRKEKKKATTGMRMDFDKSRQ
jgi:hypothetical protein